MQRWQARMGLGDKPHMPLSRFCFVFVVLFAVLGKGLVLAVCQASALLLSHSPALEWVCQRAACHLQSLHPPPCTQHGQELVSLPSSPLTWAFPQAPLASKRGSGPMEAGSEARGSDKPGHQQGLSHMFLQIGGVPLGAGSSM